MNLETKIKKALNLTYYKKCSNCTTRFKCYTVNMAERPKQLKDVNFTIADCCYRCQYSRWKRDKGLTDPLIAHNVGVCGLHNTLIHQLSLCGDFHAKTTDLMTQQITTEMENELQVTKPTGLPRFCVLEKDDGNI